jgi:phosphate-selective porin OprO and OprP
MDSWIWRDSKYSTLTLFILLLIFLPQTIYAERIFFAGYKDGFYIRSEEEGGMELRFGGAFQVDYQLFGEDGRADNGFDIRRSRLTFRGTLTRYFNFGLEYEFQGNSLKHLVDAYGETVFGLHSMRFGQFKEPFSLEWQTRDKGLYFAERSMGFYLTPGRDVGAMVHGSFFDQSFLYSAGIFNGNGVDGSTSGGEKDSPEFAARLVYSPFLNSGMQFLHFFHIGASATYGEIELSNVDLKVKSSGMASTIRNVYVLQHNSKFGVLQDVDSRHRYGVETAWARGPFAIQGEYIFLQYNGLMPSGMSKRDATFSSWYVSVLCSITGEVFILSNGVMKPLYPDHFFNPDEGTYGAVCLAARIEHFSGDKDWIAEDAFVSTEKADGVSVAVNWILFPMQRFVFDYTYTDFSDPIRSRVNTDGSIDYIDKESVLTMRFSLDF